MGTHVVGRTRYCLWAAQDAVYETVKDIPELNLIFGLLLVGTSGWVVVLIAAAIALRHAGAAQGPFVLLIVAEVFLMGGYPFPFGTLADGCFFLVSVWLELAPGGLALARQPSGA